MHGPVFHPREIGDHQIGEFRAIEQQSHGLTESVDRDAAIAVLPHEPERLHGGVGFAERGALVHQLLFFDQFQSLIAGQQQVTPHDPIDTEAKIVGLFADFGFHQFGIFVVTTQSEHHAVQAQAARGNVFGCQPFPQFVTWQFLLDFRDIGIGGVRKFSEGIV